MHVPHRTPHDPCGPPLHRRWLRLPNPRPLPRGDLFDRAVIAQLGAQSVGSGLQLATQGGGGGGPVFDAATGTTHVLESNSETVRVGAMDPALPAVLTIDSGDVVRYPNTWLMWGNEPVYGMSFDEREPIRRKYPQGPYSMPGPVALRNAEPGDVVECRMRVLRPIDWGWNSAPRAVGALPNEYEQPYLKYLRFDDARSVADFGDGVRIPLRPLQGVMSVQPAGDKPVSAILSGPWGGNIVLSELVAGTSLFLPVQVSGAKLWTGDSHAAQGDGVVDQTAIETAMEDLQIQYVLHKKSALTIPVAETPTHWITLGFSDATLDDAITQALRCAISWISSATELSPQDVYALYSIVGSFRVTQYAHQLGTVYSSVPAKTVHGMLPKAVFAPEVAAAISAHYRTGG
ncbi:MAG TPA: acetamidase/formamidase family protein [Candidatus Eremiobacteraceae bacterium]|nr:acetamidase/formamidase family protein [Candidatus Eremiobacteraceae bacterium]